jgi:ammonium transporter, Amt family
LTGILATSSVNSNVAKVANGLFISQLKAVVLTLLLSVIGTTVIAYIVKVIIGLRPTEEDELIGLDLTEHGEEGYQNV